MLRQSRSSLIKICTAGVAALCLIQPSPVFAQPGAGTVPLPDSTGRGFLNSYQLRPSSAKPASINDVAIDHIIAMPPAVKAHIRALYAAGIERGNNPHAFSAIGDSSIAGGLFLERFGTADVALGEFNYLQPARTTFADSFKRTSASVRIGLHSWTALNPVWANKRMCQPNENGIDCELRLNKPSIMFIHLGANDTANNVFDKHLRKIVEHVMAAGVVPVLITKAQPPDSKTRANNTSLRGIAAAYNVPLVDFELLARTLPNYGLGKDEVHMTNFSKPDYTQPALFKNGHAMHNLAALVALDAVWRAGTSID